jgi:cell division protein FtsA
MAKENTVLGLDIGTSKITACIGQVKEGAIDIIGVGKAPNTGMRKGMIVDIEDTVSAISAALEETERMSGVPLTSAYVSLGGSHISVVNSKGVIAVSRADGEISSADIDRVMDAARAIALPANREIIHVIPKNFIVDGQNSIKDPTGMTGIRLEAETLVIGGASAAIKNLTKCISQAGLDINDLVFSPIATAKSLLSKKQKEIGVLLIDIGAGTTTVAVFEEGDLVSCNILPIGSMHITNDIAIGLRISLDAAEKIKIKHGTVLVNKVRDSEKIDLNEFDSEESQRIERKYVAQIIEARIIEIFSLIKDELKKIGKDGMLPAGVIFTGGGCKLDGLIDFSKEYLRLPAQIGYPMLEISGMVDKLDDPVYVTSVGLMLWGLENNTQPTNKRFDLNLGKFDGMVNKAKDLFKHFIP